MAVRLARVEDVSLEIGARKGGDQEGREGPEGGGERRRF